MNIKHAGIAFLISILSGCASQAPLESSYYAKLGVEVGRSGESAKRKLIEQNFNCDREMQRGSKQSDEAALYICRRPAGNLLLSSCMQGVNFHAKHEIIERVTLVAPYCVGL